VARGSALALPVITVMLRLSIVLLVYPALLGAQTRYASEALKLRAGASAEGRVLAAVPAGSVLELRDCDRAGGEWCLVVYGRERGFVEARLLDVEPSTAGARPLSANGYSSTPLEAGGGPPASARASGRPSPTESARALAPRTSAAARGYYRGPRGGCYTYSASGRKRYVDRSLCN
jgi:uncharacterized protein YraI